MKTIITLCAAGAAFALLAVSAVADPISVANYSFESPVINSANAYDPLDPSDERFIVATGGTFDTTIPDWTFAGGVSTGIQNIAGTVGSEGTADGSQDAWLNVNSSDTTATITYSGPALPDVIAGDSYELTVAVGNRIKEGQGPEAGSDTVTLLAGSTEFSNLSPVNETTLALTAGSFADVTVVLSAATIATDDLAGQQLGIELTGAYDSGEYGDQANFDNVRLTVTGPEQSVPEPGTGSMLLGGLGLLLFIFFVRYKNVRGQV